MEPSHVSNLEEWRDPEVLSSMKESRAGEQLALCIFLRGLLVVEERSLHLSMGYSNLFQFCHQEFGLSEGSIYRRIQVARKLRAYPELLLALESGVLNLTLASMLCPYLGQYPWGELLLAVAGKSKREAQKALLDLSSTSLEPPKTAVSYLGKASYLYRLKLPADLHHKLERVRELSSHAVVDGDWAQILAMLVQTYLDRHDPQAQREVDPSFWQDYSSSSRYIPKGLKRYLLQQAEGRCQYVSEGGKRCSQTRYLDIDHIEPWALGGLTELRNLQVLCRAHNNFKGITSQTYHNQRSSVRNDTAIPPNSNASLRERWEDVLTKKLTTRKA